MTVKVVTDSICDLPPGLAQELDITVVPVYVIFGQKAYRDRVDISDDEFYHKLVYGSVYPPPPCLRPRISPMLTIGLPWKRMKLSPSMPAPN
jgi:hypothetical protein